MDKEKNIKIKNCSYAKSSRSWSGWSAFWIREDASLCWGRSLMSFAIRNRCISNADRSTHSLFWGSSFCPWDAKSSRLRPCGVWRHCNHSHSVRLGWWSCIALRAPLAVLRSKYSSQVHVSCKLQKSWCRNRQDHFLLLLFNCGLSSSTCWPHMDSCLEMLLLATSPWARPSHLVMVTTLQLALPPDPQQLGWALESAWKSVSESLTVQS